MERKVLKAGRGIQLGDVANSAIRNILTALGNDLYGKFDWEKQEATLKFFDYHCPYTGRLLVDSKTNEWIGDVALDHIIPINKEINNTCFFYCVALYSRHVEFFGSRQES